MTTVTVFHYPSLDVQHTVEDGHKHAGLVIAVQFVVEFGQDGLRTTHSGGNHSEESFSHRHEQRGWHALARHIADSEAEMIVLGKEKIVEVSTYFPGGFNHGIEVKLRALGKGRKDLGQNAHLDFMREFERFFHPLFLDIGFGQPGPFQRHHGVRCQCL
jgi:hypothetical protein